MPKDPINVSNSMNDFNFGKLRKGKYRNIRNKLNICICVCVGMSSVFEDTLKSHQIE